jgi:hypothetical protein
MSALAALGDYGASSSSEDDAMSAAVVAEKKSTGTAAAAAVAAVGKEKMKSAAPAVTPRVRLVLSCLVL